MRSIWNLWCLAALWLALGVFAHADSINSGEADGNLIKLSNSNGFGSSQMDLFSQVLDGNAVLVADMSGVPGDFSLRSVWYAQTLFPTNATYAVSAKFLPQAVEAERRGGVMGWLNLVSKKCIALFVVPEGPTASFRVAKVDFNAESGSDNESASGLYGLNGSPAEAATGSSWTELGAYSAAQVAVFELQFTPPSASELQLVTNATARVSARVYQGTDGSGKPVQVGATIELLTDLPLPDPADHRVGYFAYNGNIFADPGPVGSLDDLSGTGGYSKQNNAPAVGLFLTIPGAESRTVYHNGTTPIQKNLYESSEFGDQVILDSKSSPGALLDSFIFQYVGKNFSGDEAAQIRFYKNDGLLGKPGTLVFDSGSFDIPAAPNGATVDLGDLGAVVVPNSFTWTISFTGVDAAMGETAGLSLYGPPEMGGGFADYWARTANDWALKSVPGFDANFACLIDGTPILPSGSTMTEPAAFTLEAIATDSDGPIMRVDFYSGTSLIGSASTSPYRTQLKAVAAGSYSFTAKAFDDQGAEAASVPVQVTVKAPPGGVDDEAVLSFFWVGGKLTVSWDVKYKGQTLQTSATLSNPVWKDIAGSSETTSVVVSPDSDAVYFRLVKVTVTPPDPAAPRLALATLANGFSISWPASSTGYRLEGTESLLDPRWETVSSANNTAVVPNASASRFFRLSKP